MIHNAKVSEIRKWERDGEWYVSPDGNYVSLGNDVRLGNYVSLGNYVILGNYVSLGNDVSLGNGMSLGNGVKHESTPLQILGSTGHACYMGAKGILAVGCERHKIETWKRDYENIGKSNDYTPEQIAEYYEYIQLFARREGENEG